MGKKKQLRILCECCYSLQSFKFSNSSKGNTCKVCNSKLYCRSKAQIKQYGGKNVN